MAFIYGSVLRQNPNDKEYNQVLWSCNIAMVVKEWKVKYPEIQNLPQEIMGFRGRLRNRIPSGPLADIILPDIIRVSSKDDSLDSSLAGQVFQGFKYFLVRYELSVSILRGWLQWITGKIDSITFKLTIVNKKNRDLKVHTLQIFPRDEVLQIGEIAGEYKIMADFSLNFSNISVAPFGFTLSAAAKLDRKSVVIKKVKYPLKLAKVSAGTAGNNEIDYTFYYGEYIEPRTQYRFDMVIGFPGKLSNDYQVEINISGKTNHFTGPLPIDHAAPLRFI